MAIETMELRVRRITNEAEGINTFEFVDPNGNDLPEFTAGSHVDVHIPGGFLRQYSLCNDPRERHRYVVGVLNDPKSAGGSRSMHENVRAGDRITISHPRNNFPVRDEAKHHLLLAGGIGVTPMMAMIEQLTTTNADFTMHYCTRSVEQTAFRSRLASLAAEGRVVNHYDGGDPSKGLDIPGLLERRQEGTHLYYCGPTGFMLATKEVPRIGRQKPSTSNISLRLPRKNRPPAKRSISAMRSSRSPFPAPVRPTIFRETNRSSMSCGRTGLTSTRRARPVPAALARPIIWKASPTTTTSC